MNLKKTAVFAIFLVLFSSLFLWTCAPEKTNILNIAVAANMQFAMEQLTDEFEKESGIKCELMISSSGKLTAQIKEGAPYDVFVSANMKYPNELYNSGLTVEKPAIYAYGKLVLWSMKSEIEPSLELLDSAIIQHIASANPLNAPYGLAAEECLKYYGKYEAVSSKLVFGESVAQTNQFIVSKAVELGFTAKSVVLSPQMKGQGRWIEMDQATYLPIAQGAIVVKRKDKSQTQAIKFYEFLFSPKAQNILIDNGYAIQL